MNIKREFDKNIENFTSDLSGLIAIPSIATDPDGDFPFGKEVQRAFDYILNLATSMGFQTKNIDNFGGHIDWPGTEEGVMGIVGHIDVVPAGKGWSMDPFGGVVKDGWLYGRGAQDDKGPTMVGLYAMKILKDLGFQPKKTVRLILGLDEESSWDGMKYYLEHEKAPDFGIVPDADFPLVQCEKGLLEFDLVRSNKGWHEADTNKTALKLESMTGGSAPNMVAAFTEVRISGEKENLEKVATTLQVKAEQLHYPIKSYFDGDHLVLETTGVSAHAALPERGRNAISMTMDLLGDLVFANDDANHMIQFYNQKIGFALDGAKMACDMEDELSGCLSYNVGKIAFNQQETRLTADIRYPVTKSQELVSQALEAGLAGTGFVLEVFDHIHSIYQESDHPVVVTLIDIYREISGDRETQPSIIGGATFARAIPNCMAYGALFPGDPELEHQVDERVEIAQLLRAGQIYAEAIYRLTK